MAKATPINLVDKPGWQTTEFWTTLLAMLPALAVSLRLIPAGDLSEWNSIATNLGTGILAVVAVFKYIQSRTLVKTGAILPPVAEKTTAKVEVTHDQSKMVN